MKTPSLRLLAVVALALTIHAGTTPSVRSDTNFGNTFYSTSSTTGTLGLTNTWEDLRFTATESISVDRFAVSVLSTTNNPHFMVSLYSDNAGKPGTLLASTVVMPGTMNTAGGIYGNFGASVGLTKDTVYHAVMSVTNANTTGTTTNSVGLRIMTGVDFSHSPTTGGLDPSLNRLSSANSGTTWTPQTYQTNGSMSIFALGNANGDAVGQPVGGAYNTFGVGTTTTRGQRFLWEGATGNAVTSITLRVWKGTGNAASNLNVFLLDSSLNILSSNLFLSGGFANTTPNNYTMTLSAPLSLTNGQRYSLALQSAGSEGNSYLFFATSVSLTNMFDASFQGTNGFAITGTGLTSFNNAGSATVAYDLWFNLGIVPIPEPTSLVIALLGLGALALRRRARA